MVADRSNRRFLSEKNLTSFLKQLMSCGELFAPVREKEVVSLRRVTSADEVESNFMQTSNNLRSIIEPQNEILLTFKNPLDPSIEEKLPARDTKIALWCRPCDARAISSLDDNFIDDKFSDPYYGRRRDSAVIIGLGCNRPFPFCFCKSVGGDPFGEENLDLLMTRTREGYLIDVLTERGDAILQKIADVLDTPSPDQISEADNIRNSARENLLREAPDSEEIVSKLGALFKAPLWKKWGDKCIGCGICTYLCPTCWCFDITDLETRGKGYRIRTWDSCQFPLFTLHSSGHNPRRDKASRVRQRVMHKYSYHPANFKGRIACVGCGRCTELCPEDIDLISILEDIVKAGASDG